MDSFDEEAEQHATSPTATDKQPPTGNPVESLQQYRSKRKLTTHLKGATNLDTTATTHKSSSGKGREESKSNCRDQRKSNSSDQKHHPVRTPEEEEGKSGTTTAAIREIIQQQDGHQRFHWWDSQQCNARTELEIRRQVAYTSAHKADNSEVKNWKVVKPDIDDTNKVLVKSKGQYYNRRKFEPRHARAIKQHSPTKQSGFHIQQRLTRICLAPPRIQSWSLQCSTYPFVPFHHSPPCRKRGVMLKRIPNVRKDMETSSQTSSQTKKE